jgi:hypothetical protein
MKCSLPYISPLDILRKEEKRRNGAREKGDWRGAEKKRKWRDGDKRLGKTDWKRGWRHIMKPRRKWGRMSLVRR